MTMTLKKLGTWLQIDRYVSATSEQKLVTASFIFALTGLIAFFIYSLQILYYTSHMSEISISACNTAMIICVDILLISGSEIISSLINGLTGKFHTGLGLFTQVLLLICPAVGLIFGCESLQGPARILMGIFALALLTAAAVRLIIEVCTKLS